MASISLRNHYSEDETSTLLDWSSENDTDYQVLRSLTFQKLEAEDPEILNGIEAQIETLLAQYRPV